MRVVLISPVELQFESVLVRATIIDHARIGQTFEDSSPPQKVNASHARIFQVVCGLVAVLTPLQKSRFATLNVLRSNHRKVFP